MKRFPKVYLTADLHLTDEDSLSLGPDGRVFHAGREIITNGFRIYCGFEGWEEFAQPCGQPCPNGCALCTRGQFTLTMPSGSQVTMYSNETAGEIGGLRIFSQLQPSEPDCRACDGRGFLVGGDNEHYSCDYCEKP